MPANSHLATSVQLRPCRLDLRAASPPMRSRGCPWASVCGCLHFPHPPLLPLAQAYLPLLAASSLLEDRVASLDDYKKQARGTVVQYSSEISSSQRTRAELFSLPKNVRLCIHIYVLLVVLVFPSKPKLFSQKVP